MRTVGREEKAYELGRVLEELALGAHALGNSDRRHLAPSIEPKPRGGGRPRKQQGGRDCRVRGREAMGRNLRRREGRPAAWKGGGG